MKIVLSMSIIVSLVMSVRAMTPEEMRTCVSNVISTSSLSAHDCARISDWGLTVDTAISRNLAVALSNNWSVALADWPYYSSNRLCRVVLLNTIGKAGASAYLQMLAGMFDLYAASTNVCTRADLLMTEDAIATPMEDYLMLHYNDPVVSNLLIRASDLMQDRRAFYQKLLSGAAKTEHDELEAAGAL